jgi:hypothetical protein
MTEAADSSPVSRREAVAMIGAAAGAMLAPATTVHGEEGAANIVSGIVYDDRSRAGTRQASDPGLAAILVSNGRDVVRTDADGRYQLPISDEGLVFVIKPARFSVPLDADNLPRFTYLHQPNGTPAGLGLRYKGVEPSGPLPASVDFALTRAEEPQAFDVILFTDPQPESGAELDFVRDTALANVVGTKAAFGMTTGDIMFDDLSLYPRYNRLIGQIGVPWWHIGGNHDLNFEAPDAARSRETFKRTYGAPYYAFNYGSALFLMLDNVNYLGAATAPYPGGGGKYEGRFGERQLAFVANVLRETPQDRLVVVAMHIPLVNDINPNEPADVTADRDELLKLLAGRPVLSISGHTHTTEHHYLGANGEHHHHVMTAVSGSWWSGPYDRRGIACADSRDGSPHGFHVLSIDGNRYTTRFVPAAEPERRAMRIVLESQFHENAPELARDYRIAQLFGSPIPAESAGATYIVVNVFDGGPKTRVRSSIGGRNPVDLRRIRRRDPFVQQIYLRNPLTKKSWVKAEPSSHIWMGRLPGDLEPGTHRADVQVTDEYGRELQDHLLIEVVVGATTTAPRRT